MPENAFPPQTQDRMPGLEHEMSPRPEYRHPDWKPSGLLEGKIAVITGADSGIGRAVAYLFAQEGADIVVGYLNEHEDARKTAEAIRELGRRCRLVPGDLSQPGEAEKLVAEALKLAPTIDIFVQNASVQFEAKDFAEEPAEQISETVRVNLLGGLYAVHAALPHMRRGSAVIVTTSVTAYRGSPHLVDYAATKGALATLVYALGEQKAKDGIRVNGVAPGPVWTPLIPGSFTAEEVANFGKKTPMGRAAQPWEIAPAYLFLASERWSGYVTGQVVHPNGGEAVNA
jgi:NAD(P)-dependent dehydrogenase (short-subunit alcohol dehydrogenase family)